MMQRLRNFTVYVAIVIMLITMMAPISIVSASLTEGDFEYEDNGDGTATVIGYIGVSKDVVIPDSVGVLKVTRIGDMAFSEKQLTSVIIPDSITEIGAYAFLENQLTEVIIPDSVIEIGYGAFQENQLANVTISKNITMIKDSTFFLNNLSSVIIPDGITEIGFGAFAENRLTHLRIPHNVTVIKGAAFADNQLTFVSIPKSVASIGFVAFYNNQLETVIIHNPSITIEPGGDILPDNTVIPEVFDGNQSNPADLTLIGHLGSTAEAYATSHGHTFTDIATVPPIVEAVDVQVLYGHIVRAKVPFQVQLTVDEGIPVTSSVHHYVRVESDKEGTVINDVYTPFNRHSSDYETTAILDVTLTLPGTHEVTVTVDGGSGDTVTVEVTIDQNSSSGGGSGSGNSGGSFGGVAANPTTNTSEISMDGGIVTLNRVTLTFPAQALNGTFKVAVEKVSNTSRLPLAENLILASDVFEITKDKAGHFDKSITISIPFNKSVIDFEKYDIAIYWLDEETGEWIKLDHIKVDIDKGVVSGDVDHFTKFAVIATEKAAVTEQPKTVQLSDITGHWAEANIQALIRMGVITGYPNGTFLPDHRITRAEFVTMLVKAFGLVASEGKVFADTAQNWAKDAIGIAAALGIVTGYNGTNFGADDYITREQMAAMIARAMNLHPHHGDVNFTDKADISSWAVDAISAAVYSKIITGYPDHSFKPQGNATRAEAITVLNRTLEQ